MTFLSVVEMGSGTAESTTVTAIVSEVEQYFNFGTVTPVGRQSLKSTLTSWPDFVNEWSEHVKPLIPVPVRSIDPAPVVYFLRFTFTVSFTPKAPALPS